MFTNITPNLQDELYPNESLLWWGQPPTGLRFRANDIFVVPFSLLWGGFACFWEITALSHGPSFFALWGIPFVLVGNYMIWGRFLVDAWQRSRSYYAVTDQRVIIVSGLFGQKVKSLNLRTLSDVSMDQKSDGSGSITFGPTHPRYYASTWPGTAQLTPAFEMIPNVKDVYRTIHEAQRAI